MGMINLHKPVKKVSATVPGSKVNAPAGNPFVELASEIETLSRETTIERSALRKKT